MDEVALIQDACQGDLTAFNRLVLAYQDMVYNQAYRVIGETDAAEDATQEAFISAYEPYHQAIFRNAGLIPRGYIPGWKYNSQNKKFEDHVLFNQYQGNIDAEIQLIPDGNALLKRFKWNK